MGAGISSPISDETQAQMEAIVKDTAATFGKAYPKAYAMALLNKVTEDAKGGDSSGYELLARPEAEESKEPLKTGWMTKEGGNVKNWKKRFFVVRYDYKIDYFDKEETFKAGGNPKGTINPCGYEVEADPSSFLAKKAEQLAEKLHLDAASVPSVKTFPEHTVGLLQERCRPWYIQFESAEQKADWIPMLKTCCYWADGYSTQDPVAREAFSKAFDKTAVSRGYLGSGWFKGSEQQHLSTLIFLQIKHQLLDGVFDSIADKVSNAKIRVMVTDKVEGVISTTVNTAVSGAWAVANKAVESFRPTAESKLKSNIDKIQGAQDSVSDKLRGAVGKVVDPACSKFLSKVLEPVLPKATGPVEAALRALVAEFTAKSEEVANAAAEGKDEWSGWAYWPKRSATLEGASEKLEMLRKISDVADHVPELKDLVDKIGDAISDCLDACKDLLDRASYTMFKKFQDKTKEGKDKAAASREAREETQASLLKDCLVAFVSILKSLIGGVVKPRVLKEVAEPCQDAMAPVQDAIPDFLKDIIDLDGKLEETVDGIVDDGIDAAIKPSLPKF